MRGKKVLLYLVVAILSSSFIYGVECGSEPTDGCIVTQNTKFQSGNYYLPKGIEILADNLFLDCNEAVLRGNSSSIGISVINRSGVTIRRCNIQNYSGSGLRSISVKYSSNIKIYDNIFYDLAELWECSNIEFYSNKVVELQDWKCSDSQIKENYIRSTRRVNDYALVVVEGNNNLYLGNIIEGKAFVIAAEHAEFRDNLIYNSSIGLELNAVEQSGFYNNVIRDNGIGVFYWVMNTKTNPRNVFHNNEVFNNGVGFQTSVDMNSVYSNNKVYNNSKGFYFTWSLSNVSVYGNNITNNSVGIVFDTSYGYALNLVEKNNMFGNIEYNVVNDGNNNISLENNWWGTTDEAEIRDSIYDCENEATKGCVDFIPYSEEPYIYIHCNNGIKDGDEIDIDCGRSCPPCSDGKSCLINSDCQSNYCNPNNLCSTPNCSDGWKNQDEEDIDCGGSCPSCEPKYVYLWFPVVRWADDNEFRTEAEKRADFFMDISPLYECKDDIHNEYVPLSWVENNCGEDSGMDITKGEYNGSQELLTNIHKCALFYRKQKGRWYDKAIGFSKWPIGSLMDPPFSGISIRGSKVAYAETKAENASLDDTKRLEIPAHEIGHTYYLCDEYKYLTWLDQNRELRCPNRWSNTVCNKSGKGDVCYGIDGQCCGALSYRDYSGPYTAEGTICEGTTYSIHGSGVSEHRCGFGEDSYNHLKDFLDCSLIPQFGKVEETIIKISKDNNIILDEVFVGYGKKPFNSSINSSYKAIFSDKDNKSIKELNLTPSFYIVSDGNITEINETIIEIEIPFPDLWHSLTIEHNETVIFKENISDILCNNNSICEENENYYSCSDCSSGSDDGICDKVNEGICDPDCAKGIDPDCKEYLNISLNQGWNLISIPLNLSNNSIGHIFNNTNLTIYSYKNNSWFIPNKIENKLGYWLKINESKNIPLVGTEIENKTINLNNGWNLIGYPYLEEKNISGISDNYTIYSYNITWLSYIPERSFNSLKKLKPGYGYWVKTK